MGRETEGGREGEEGKREGEGRIDKGKRERESDRKVIRCLLEYKNNYNDATYVISHLTYPVKWVVC